MQRNQFVAHRGWQKHYPENTLIGFEEAIKVGATNIELDVQLNADARPYCFHDATLLRMCKAPGNIWDYTNAELSELFASESGRLGDDYNTEPLCPLSDVVDLLQRHPHVTAYIEIKAESIHHFGREVVLKRITDCLQDTAKQCAVISFDLDILLLAKRQGWQLLLPVFDKWPDWQQEKLRELDAKTAFIDAKAIPDDTALEEQETALVIYEVGNAQQARYWLSRGAHAVETYAIGELLRDFGLARAGVPPIKK